MANVHTQVLGRRAGARKGIVVLSVTVPNAAAVVDQNIFAADQAYQVVSVEEVHAVKGSDGSAVTLDVRNLTGTASPDLGASVLAATFNLKGDADTVQSGTLHATLGNTQLAAGDRLAIDIGGTPTAVVGVAVTIVLIPLTATLGDTGDRRYWLSEV